MIKKNLKFLTVFILAFAIISSFSFCFADTKEKTDKNENKTETSNTTTEEATSAEQTTAENANEENKIHEGDLYLCNPKVNMDQLVDGNVYILANDVTISGQINGNLFVCATSVHFTEESYVRYTVYACANSIQYEGGCNDFYVAANRLETSYKSYVIRDAKIASSSVLFKSAVGRDVDLQASSVSFGDLAALEADSNDNTSESEPEVPIIYGNIRYSANAEQPLSNKVVQGDINYSGNSLVSGKSVVSAIKDIVISFLMVVATTLALYALLAKFKKEDIEKLGENHAVGYIFKNLGIGLLVLVAGIVLTILLLATQIGAKLALIVAAALTLIGLLATPIAAIYITNVLKPVLKIEKTYLYYIVLALVAIILYGLSLIPYAGTVIGCLVFLFGYGLISTSCVPCKAKKEEA